MRTSIFCFLFFLLNSCRNVPNEIADNFVHLPETVSKPWCYYYWINDDISKDGITKDLIAMKQAGIGAALIGNINPAGKNGKVPLFSETWWDAMVHAVSEGRRLGIDIGVFNCPGWSQSGGPWITPDKSMRYIRWTETKLSGPGKITTVLPKPENSFQDISVIAFPTLAVEKEAVTSKEVKVNSIPLITSVENLADGDTATCTILDISKKKFDITLNFSREIEANSIRLFPSRAFKANCKLYAIQDHQTQLVREFYFDRSNLANKVGPIVSGPLALSLPGIKSNRFLLVVEDMVSGTGLAGFSEIQISEEAVLEEYIEKQLGKMHPTPLPEWNSYSWNDQTFKFRPELIVPENKMLDISANMQPDGTLVWDVPDGGDWTVLRFGMSPTGVRNHPVAPQGIGLEVDKLSTEKVQFHFENFVGELIKRIPENDRTALKYVVIDSYEVGSQNWTDGYRDIFKKKYGYDPAFYLPVLTGRIVGSVTESERFLWDLRRAVADDIAYKYVGCLKKISNEHNMKLWLENYGHWGYPSEFLKYGGQADLVSGEFWNEGTLGNIECKAASSAAHVYGKPVVSAEAFTSSSKAFLRHPASLKARGDWSFTEGINHLVLHVYIHQPDDQRVPGVNAWFGTEFNRHNTWYSQMSSWTDYVRRCQFILQQGTYVADVCYFIGEDAPIMTGGRLPELPKGFSYDYINAEVIMDRLSVKDGMLVLPDGMSYRLMVLPPLEKMRPEVLSKIEELVRQGANILGSRPKYSPSLENYPDCDKEVKEIADLLWGKDFGSRENYHQYHQGAVYENMDIKRVLDIMKIEKDIDIEKDVPVRWTHRRTSDMEIYFLTNQSEIPQQFEASFRVNHLKPQLWDAISGSIRNLNDYKISGGKTFVALEMKPLESYFIIFTNKKNKFTKTTYTSNFPVQKVIQSINGKWQVDFHNQQIGPAHTLLLDSLSDWASSTDTTIRYYSGDATYRTSFTLNTLVKERNIFLNLGKLGVMARVRLNGKYLGGLWMPPYLINTSGFLKEGENTLEVDVVNLWRNRLIHDKSLPAGKRYSWTVIDDIKPGEELQPSGLLGPVTLELME